MKAVKYISTFRLLAVTSILSIGGLACGAHERSNKNDFHNSLDASARMRCIREHVSEWPRGVVFSFLSKKDSHASDVGLCLHLERVMTDGAMDRDDTEELRRFLRGLKVVSDKGSSTETAAAELTRSILAGMAKGEGNKGLEEAVLFVETLASYEASFAKKWGKAAPLVSPLDIWAQEARKNGEAVSGERANGEPVSLAAGPAGDAVYGAHILAFYRRMMEPCLSQEDREELCMPGLLSIGFQMDAGRIAKDSDGRLGTEPRTAFSPASDEGSIWHAASILRTSGGPLDERFAIKLAKAYVSVYAFWRDRESGAAEPSDPAGTSRPSKAEAYELLFTVAALSTPKGIEAACLGERGQVLVRQCLYAAKRLYVSGSID